MSASAEMPGPRAEPTPRWIRVRHEGRWIADSRRALVLLRYFGPGALPTYCFPPEDVADDSEAIRLEGLEGEMAPANGLLTFPWDDRFEWFEEATRVFVHARDPHKRVDVVESTRSLEVSVDGTVLARSSRPHALFETWLPTRWYLPAEDVRMDLLEESPTVTACPYKGTARYWSYGGRDIAWSYPEPIPECPRIRDLVCFFNERVDMVIDGEPVPRPVTPWS